MSKLIIDRTIEQQSKPWYWHLIIVSIALAGIVGLTEALVAVYFVGTFSLAVLFPALIINLILYRSDIFDLLNAIANRKLFRDSNGQYFCGIKALILKLALGLALFAGTAGAFLQFNSILVTFGTIAWGLSATAAIASPPLALIILASSLVFVSALANCALLYANVERFVREDYKPYWKTIKLITGLSKNKQPLFWRIYHGLFAIVGLTFAISIYIITFGLFKQQAYKVFNSFWKLSASSSLVLTKIIVYPGQILNGFFYGRNLINFTRKIEDFIKELLNKILPSNYQDLKDEKNSSTQSSVLQNDSLLKSLFVISSSALAYILIFGCAAINGHAQGQGAANEQAAWNWLTKMFSEVTATKIAYVVMSVGSISANFFASLDEKWLQPSADYIARFKGMFKFSHVVSTHAAPSVAPVIHAKDGAETAGPQTATTQAPNTNLSTSSTPYYRRMVALSSQTSALPVVISAAATNRPET